STETDNLPFTITLAILMIPDLFVQALFPLNFPAWSLFFELWVNIVYAFTFRLLTLRVLVPRHSDFDGLNSGSKQLWQVFRIQEHFYAAGDPRLPFDKAGSFEGYHHLVNRGGLTRKYCCRSVSAGGRRCRRV